MKPILIVLLFLLGAPLVASGQDNADNTFYVIVHADNAETSIKRRDLRRIYLKKMTKWTKANKAILAVDQSKNSDVRKVFTDKVFSKTVNQIVKYWHKMVYSGKNVPPTVLKSDKAVVNYVKKNLHAIGYVSSKKNLDGVKVIVIKE